MAREKKKRDEKQVNRERVENDWRGRELRESELVREIEEKRRQRG